MRIKSYINRTQEFHQIYSLQIAPIYRMYEQDRKKILTEINFLNFLVCILFLFMFFIPPLFFIQPLYKILLSHTHIIVATWVIYYAIVLFVSFRIIPYKIKTKIKEFSNNLKEKCFPKILPVFKDFNLSWERERDLITSKDLEASGLFVYINYQSNYDQFYGEYKNVPFKICETKLLGARSQNEDTREFKGVLITFKSNKRIKDRTIIETHKDIFQEYGYIIALLCIVITLPINLFYSWKNTWIYIILLILFVFLYSKNQREKLENFKEEKVKLEDIKFHKRFNIYSSDQVEARYLLTPAFVERFRNLQTAFNAKLAKCAFYGDEIMFALSTEKNLFEIGSVYTSLNNSKSINDFYNEIYSILRLIEYFKLDEKTGL